MRSKVRVAARAMHWASLALLGFAVCSCSSGSSGRLVEEQDSPRREQRIKTPPPIPPPLKDKGPRKEPPALAAETEKEQIDRIVELVRRQGTTRVIIRLEDSALPAIAPPNYDPRARRSEIRTDPDLDQAARAAISKAQSRFLEKFERGDNRRVTHFQYAPYLAMDLSLADAQTLRTWIAEETAGSDARPFRIWVEPDIKLRKQSAPAAPSYCSVEEAARHMEFTDTAPATTPSTVIIVDDRIEDSLHLLHSRVDALLSVEYGGVVSEVPLSPDAVEPSDYYTYEPSHGTKLALIVAKSAPHARIIGIDVFGSDIETDMDRIANALQVVLRMRETDRSRPIAAVCVSIGFAEFATAGECDCGEGSLYAGCPSLKPAMRDHVNLLAAQQIPVVISAGSESVYAGEVLYPACITTAITVGGTIGGIYTPTVERSGWSNWGPMLDLCAQGALLTLQLDQWKPETDPNAICYFGSGSSFAVPFVGAAFSVLLDEHPEANCMMIDEALRKEGSCVPYAGVSVPEIRVTRASKWLESPPPADTVPVATTIVSGTSDPVPAPR